ncbi:MAG: manganese catalase family protein [Oscillospiraceae bacterium]|nr:manganese catalase family protein [Oscillospiraceae bacterium]
MFYDQYVYDKYENKLQYPVNIKNNNPKLAQAIISQLGGPDGELAASLRYLNQRYAAPYAQVKGVLTDIGTEELAHLEMISAILYQLTRNLTMEQIKESGFDTYFVDHTTGIYPIAASGAPFTASYFQSKGDPITDLVEDLAAEQKARTTYDNILRLTDDPDVRDPIKFLREREIVHFQRFGEALRITQDNLNSKNFYAFNPSFDK